MAQPEPWLRGTLPELDPLRRGVVHALWLASEDIARWCSELSPDELDARPFGLPAIGFHMRHMVHSLDRLLTYAEGGQLNAGQMAALGSELAGPQPKEALFAEFKAGMAMAEERVRHFSPEDYSVSRGVGRELLPSTGGGLLVHCADHTQRHCGQAVTTAKLLLQLRG